MTVTPAGLPARPPGVDAAPADLGTTARSDQPGFWRRAATTVGSGAAVVFVLAVHGYLPGMSQVPLTALFGTGAIQCLHDQGIASLGSWCMSLGLPIGAPRMTGLPEVYLGWLVSYIPGLDAWAAHQISMGTLDVVAFLGAYALGRRWGMPRWVAIGATVSYLTAANVLVLNGYPYTLMGYLLLPTAVYACLRLLDLLDEGRWLIGATGALLLSVFLAFTDGYAFFCAALVIGALVLGWAMRSRSERGWRSSLAGGGIWLGSLAGAALLYATWVPRGAYETDVPFEYFALLAVDVVTLVVPSKHFLYPQLLGIDPPQLTIWGIADTLPTNYLGFGVLALVVLFLATGRRRALDRTRFELIVVAVAGAVALVLALGPTLKVGQIEPGLDAGLLDLPTAWILEHVPGISEMRATNRWLIVTRFACVMLAAAGLTYLWRSWRGASRWRGVAVVLIGCLAMLETAPNLWAVARQRSASIALVQLLRDGLVAEADEMLVDDETVLILPSVNDFLANYVVPMTGTQSYNVGGDKNYYLSVSTWPQTVLTARAAYGTPDAAAAFCAALATDVDAIVLPYMSPYEAPLLRPRHADQEEERRRIAAGFLDDPRFDTEVGQWVTVLRGTGEQCGAR